MSATVEVTSDVLRHRAEVAVAQGDFTRADRYLREALELCPSDHEALALTAEMRLRQGQTGEAFSLYVRAVNACPNVHLYKERFLELARRGLSVSHSDELEMAVVACLQTPDLAGAVENWASLLMANPDFHAAFGLANKRAVDHASSAFDVALLIRPLFLEGLKSDVVCHPGFEEFVTQLRQHLLESFSTSEDGFAARECILVSALSHYAFFTDFILDETDEERTRIDALQRRIETEDETNERAASAIAIFACYRPLNVLAIAREILETFRSDQILADVVKTQIADDLALREIESSIPAATPIDDETSLNVRRQYELFPYPRWKAFSKSRIIQNWENEECSRRMEASLRTAAARILIAGCGTGRDAAIYSVRFPGASITAVDLSRTSLAYAANKARELGLENLTFLHGDILNLPKLAQTFDYISCTGVLHHLEDPVAGLKTLCHLLEPGGLMRIGLYSSTGRKAVSVVQDAAKRANYPPTREGILRFRRDCPRICDHGTMQSLTRLKDYYHLNMYRDLLFPAKEHRFDLSQIKDILGRLGLSFEGFYLSDEVLAKYRAMFPKDGAATDLDGWRSFETRYPETFVSMYIFWCRKAQTESGVSASLRS